MITYTALFQFCMFIVALVGLLYNLRGNEIAANYLQ